MEIMADGLLTVFNICFAFIFYFVPFCSLFAHMSKVNSLIKCAKVGQASRNAFLLIVTGDKTWHSDLTFRQRHLTQRTQTSQWNEKLSWLDGVYIPPHWRYLVILRLALGNDCQCLGEATHKIYFDRIREWLVVFGIMSCMWPWSPLTNSFFTAGTFKLLKHQKVPSAWIWATKGHDKCCTWAYLAWEWAGLTQWINKHVHIKGEVFPGLIA